MDTILITGACGQLGTELTIELRQIYGSSNVIATDITDASSEWPEDAGPFEYLDVLDKEKLGELIDKYQVTQVYHLAALLSAKAEKQPQFGWELNTQGLLNVLDLAKENDLKVYWPSSIAVFGNNSPKDNTPQLTVMNPDTAYGISKLAGEQWCEYYHQNYNVDVRSLRYPGLIGYKSLPGGGTTDYAVEIYHQALKGESFDCFLAKGTYLPMMYMADAIKATIQLMQADAKDVKIRSSYNVAAISFSPEEIAASIQKYIPDFEISYHPDYRQAIADSWPNSIDDSAARAQWGWQHDYDIEAITKIMIENLAVKLPGIVVSLILEKKGGIHCQKHIHHIPVNFRKND